MKKLQIFQISKKHSYMVKGGTDPTGAADTCDTTKEPITGAADTCDIKIFTNSNIIFTQK